MIALLQRVTEASVSVEKRITTSIRNGVLIFVAVESHDDEHLCKRMAERVLGYRIFADDDGRMNKSVSDIRGEVLFVPQFTLAADTHKGMRPSFSSGATPKKAENLFLKLIEFATENYGAVKAGHFGVNMQIALINDGPATFLLRSKSMGSDSID